jgi:hypothetical protein
MIKMKTTGSILLALVICFTILVVACSGIFDPTRGDVDSTGQNPGADQAIETGKGRLEITLPSISPYLGDTIMGKPGAKGLPRALMFASRAELELRDAMGALIDQWTVQALSSMEYSNGSVGAVNSRDVPTGSGYILSAKVYNDQVSVTEAVLTSSVGNITIIAGSSTSVSIPCIPAANITIPLSVGVVTGSLVPGMLSGTAFTAIGGEAWYEFTSGVGNNRVSFSLSSEASISYAAIYRADGSWMNQSAASAQGSTSTSSVPVIPGQTYYIGVVLLDDSVEPATYTLTLTESATGPDLVANGDFSSGTAGWTLRVPGPATAILEAPLVGQSTTNKELKATVTDTVPYLGIVLDRRALSIEAGKTYLLGFRAKVNSGTAAISLGLGYMDGSTLVSYGEGPGGNQAQYYRYYENAIAVTGAATSEGVVYARVLSSDTQNLDFSLDDISLVDVTATLPATTIACAGTWYNPLFGKLTLTTSSGYNFDSSNVLTGQTEMVMFDNQAAFLVQRHVIGSNIGKYQKVYWTGTNPVTNIASSNIFFDTAQEAIDDTAAVMNFPVSEDPPSVSVLLPPTNLSAVQDAMGRNVTLSWDAVDGATAYILSRTGGGRTGSATVDGTLFDDTSSGLIGNWYGIEYHYSVAAKDANGTGTAASVAFTRSAKPVSGSVESSGLAAGDYPLVIFDEANNLYMSQIVTLDSAGSGAFSINGGEFVPELRFKAWIDTGTGPDSSYWINTGDRVCWVYNFDNYSVEDGTITEMYVGDVGWTTVGNIPVLAEAHRLDSTTVRLSWQDKMSRGIGGLDGVMIERSENGGTYLNITSAVSGIDCLVDPADRFNARSCNDDAPDGNNYMYRIGFDANANGSLDSGEYAQTDSTGS